MQDPEEEHEFLEQLLRSRELNCLVKMHNVILFCNQEQCPCVSNCCEIALEVMEDVRPFALMIEECRELYAILTTPHLRVSCSGLFPGPFLGHLYQSAFQFLLGNYSVSNTSLPCRA